MSFFGELFGIKSKKTILIVHLGNIGKDQGAKTRKYAERFLSAGFKFIGIDATEAPLNLPQNWEQIQDDFVRGLKRLKDNSVDIISSEMAVGHYEYWQDDEIKFYKEEYTLKIMKQIWNKLKPNGKVMIVVGDDRAEKCVEDAIKKFPFVKVVKRKLSPDEIKRTSFMVKYSEKPYDYLSSGLFQIIAEKPRL